MVGLVALGVFAAPLPILLGILILPFGPELVVLTLVLNVSAEPTPPGIWSIHQLETDTVQGLMHSRVYEDPIALEQLVAWIQKRISDDQYVAMPSYL